MKWDVYHLLTLKYRKYLVLALIILFFLLIVGKWLNLLLHPIPSIRSDLNLQPSTVHVPKENYQALLNTSLFGRYVTHDLTDVKKSMLHATVVGILIATEPSQSQVIIKSANDEGKTYKVGDMIPGDALIKRIMSWGILVERDGEIESLSLPQEGLTFEPVPGPLHEE